MNNDTLRVYKNLQAKFKLFGLELVDLLIMLFVGTVMNLFFGRSTYGVIVVITAPIIFGLLLFYLKRGKPDGHLLHYFRFMFLEGCFYASDVNDDPNKWRKVNDLH